MKEFKASIYNDELLKLDFDESLKKNYYLILANIYYINLKKMQQNFRKEIEKNVKFLNSEQILTELDKIYEKTIKETRELVFKHFQVTKKDFEFKSI
jgi:hypothetical protein